MTKGICTLIFSQLLWLAVIGQPQPLMRIDTTRESVAYWQQWMEDLNRPGVEKTKDSFFVREEVVRILKDSQYRKTVYPSAYTWEGAVALLNRMELKKAFWHMLNLYDTDSAHRNIVVGSFVLYDSLMDMDKIMISTFYTYAFADPQACRIVNNKPDIFRPDILERKLRLTREIIGYIWLNREQRKKKP